MTYEEFVSLYDSYIDKIYRFVYFKTHHKETAEDLVSETFLKALENIHSFNPAKGKFSSWIYQIARNTVVDHYRSFKRNSNVEDIWDLSDNSDIARDADLNLQLGKVKIYLKELSPRHREIITLRLWQELSYEEIAEITGSSKEASKMMFSRAIKELRQKMPASLLFALIFLFR